MEISLKYFFLNLNYIIDYFIIVATWFYISPEDDYNNDILRLSHQKDILVFAFLAIYFIIRIFISIRKHERLAIENDIKKEELREKRLKNDVIEKSIFDQLPHD